MDIKEKFVLGISYGYHDSAVALVKDGIVISAVEEERFTGIKHDNSFPINSIKWITKSNNISVDDISYVCFYENPVLKDDRNNKMYWKYWYKNIFKFKVSGTNNKHKPLLQNLFPVAVGPSRKTCP